MSKQLCPDTQTHLWPDDVMASLAGHPRPKEPLPPLPWTEREAIDVKRAAKILAVSEDVIRQFLRKGVLTNFSVRSAPSIKYEAIVTFCDDLRLKYGFPARKPPTGIRPKDIELLPFPMSESMNTREVAMALEKSETTVIHLLEEGTILGYKLLPVRRIPWRIHEASVRSYILSLHAEAARSSSQNSNPQLSR